MKSRINLLALGKMMCAFALFITTMNVNTTCVFQAHQPKLPKGAEKLRKV
ncbi:hypothetical protein SDC9_196302 [bioreactor metagenome]|uniref:Cyclic lactone autoinducer peptide n=1 Tax=bioreactor metagenome TaxID=1076179 RepID=A0A645IC32_9ZZZZ|nr:cyclic lactone autoinducer peptide [Lachnospiraceae bacterium]